MYDRILVAIDGSATASRGLAEAIKLAVDQKAVLRVLYVVSNAYVDAVLGSGYSSDLLRRIREEAQSTLERARAEALSADLVPETHMAEHQGTQIGEAIVEDARQWNARLIVMGTHGRRGVARIVLGSDAAYVVQHAPVPVLLVRSVTR